MPRPKISAKAFVVGYSVILLILFVIFSILMSKVNPHRMYFDDEVGPDQKITPDDQEKGEGGEIPVTNKPDANTPENIVPSTGDALRKVNLAKERRSVRDRSSVLDQLGIVVLEVVDEEGLPRIEIMFHPKRSIIKRRNKKRGGINIKKSFRAYDKAKTGKGLVTELTENSVIKIMPDNTIVLENSNILLSEENVTPNSCAEMPSTNLEITLFHSDNLDAINTTENSVIVAVNDKRPSETATFESNVSLKIVDEKHFKDFETIETTTDEAFEGTTNIDNLFESEDATSSKTSFLPEAINPDAFENNGSIIATYGYTLETTNLSEKYNNTETTGEEDFDVNDTITTELITETDVNSFTRITNKQTLKENYATEKRDDIIFDIINSQNASSDVLNYEVSATTVSEPVKTVDISDIFDRNVTSDGKIYRVSDIYETREDNLALENKEIIGGKTFDTDDKVNAVYATDKDRNIFKTARDANISEAIAEHVESLLNAETTDVTDLSLQKTETSIITSALESTTDMQNLLKVLPVINNAANALGNTVDNTIDTHATAESVSKGFEGYFAATENIFNDV